MAEYDGEKTIIENTFEIAKLCLQAAYKAPEMTGKRVMQSKILTGDDVLPIIEVMEEISQFITPLAMDALAYRLAYARGNCPTVILFASILRKSDLNYNCGACGFDTCAEFNKYTKENPPQLGAANPGPCCIWKTFDFSMAVDWACAAAWQYNVTNRVQGTAGMAASLLGYFEEYSAVLALPIGPAVDDLYWYNRPPELMNTVYPHDMAMRSWMTFLPTYWGTFPGAKPIVKDKDKWWERPQTTLAFQDEDPKELERSQQDMAKAFEAVLRIRAEVEAKRKQREQKE